MSTRKGRSMFDPLHWRGALALPENAPTAPKMAASRWIEDAPLSTWLAWCLPTYNQLGPCCVGQGWANWLELMLRRYVGGGVFKPGEQISGERIWRRGREMFWNGDMDGGLYIPQGFDALKDLGYVPPESQLLAVNLDWASVGYALLTTPLVQGHHVHKGWYDPDPASGCIDHEPAPTNADGYHCTLRIGRLAQKGVGFYLSQNSWGNNWGWNGCFMMTEAEDSEGRMPDGPYTANLPPGWREWEGWKKGVVMAP